MEKYDDNGTGEVLSITINGRWKKKRTEYVDLGFAASTAFTERGSDENNIDLGAKPLQAEDCPVAQRREVSSIQDQNLLLIEEVH